MQIKRLPVLLVFIIFLFLIPSQNRTSSSCYIEIAVPNDIDFELIGEAQIFGTVPFDVNQTYAQTLASALFDLTGTISEDEYCIRIENGSETFEMYSACGSIWYADESKLWNVSYTPDIPEIAVCEALADKFVTSSPYFDTTAAVYFGSTNATAYNSETQEMKNKTLDLNVNYGYELNGIPFGGPGASSSVTLGDKGEIIGFNWIKRKTTPMHYVPLIKFEDVLTLHGYTDYISVEHELVYYQDEVGEAQDYIYPVYEVEITKTFADIEYSRVIFLPATTFNPKVSIITPSIGKTFTSGDLIDFNCNASFGTSPYTYTWVSDIDGFLSDKGTFQYDALSTASKNSSSVSHTIELTIIDANGLTAIDITTVEIIPTTTGMIGIEYLTIISILGITLSIFFSKQKNKRIKSIATAITIIALFATSSVIQISTVNATSNNVIFEIPLKPAFYDDDGGGVYEIGAEYVQYSGSDRLSYADDAARRFYNKLGGSSVWNKVFKYGNDNAWEEDFKMASAYGGGTDSYYIDSVDIAYYRGHGIPEGITFSSWHDNQILHYGECEWGDGDLEWIILDTCWTLRYMDHHLGRDVFYRWGPRLKGLHMICGFRSMGTDSPSRGEKFAKHAIDGHTVRYSWFKAAKQTTSYKRWSAIFYGSNSDDTWHPQQDDPYRDHLHGYGYVASDPYPARWLVWISSQC